MNISLKEELQKGFDKDRLINVIRQKILGMVFIFTVKMRN